MSHPSSSSVPGGDAAGNPDSRSPAAGLAPVWADPAREAAFQDWLRCQADLHGLDPATVRVASADASFRRYFRVDRADGAGSCIVMDAPPEQENCAPFVKVAGLMASAGLNVPEILAWDEARGFMLLSDLGSTTMMSAIDPARFETAAPLYASATDVLIAWQRASRPGTLPTYDAALLHRELALFPDWYLGHHRGVTLTPAQAQVMAKTFDTLVARNLAAPQVHVHRDFMPRNLMVPPVRQTDPVRALGVLDFQDAVMGPLSYDIASLMRDAFLSWEEDIVLDVTIRYWEKARQAGLMDFEDWHSDFGAFWRAVEWMGLQRHLKVAGIFARLTLRDGKPKYLADTPRFMGYIRATASRYRELGPLLRLIDEVEGTSATTGYAFGRI